MLQLSKFIVENLKEKIDKRINYYARINGIIQGCDIVKVKNIQYFKIVNGLSFYALNVQVIKYEYPNGKVYTEKTNYLN